MNLERDAFHVLRRRHFHRQRNLQNVFEEPDIPILNMTPVFTEMRHDTVSPVLLRDQRRIDRFRKSFFALLAKRRDVINVNTKPHGSTPLTMTLSICRRVMQNLRLCALPQQSSASALEAWTCS